MHFPRSRFGLAGGSAFNAALKTVRGVWHHTIKGRASKLLMCRKGESTRKAVFAAMRGSPPSPKHDKSSA
jgi:hypothetical protein